MWASFEKKQQARKQFMEWLARNHPSIAGSAFGHDVSVSGLSDWGIPTFTAPDTRTDYVTRETTNVPVKTQKTTASPQQKAVAENWWQSAVKNVTEALPQLATSYYQTRAISSNMKRAEAGLPPVDYSATGPTVNVKGSADPELTRTILMVGGIIGAALFLPALLKR